MPGCTKSPGAALRAVTRPVIGHATTSVEVDFALGYDAIDFGFRLAEDCDGVARCQQRAFGGLLVGNRLVEVLLRGGFGREERLLTVQDAGLHQQDAVRGDQCGLPLQQVRTVDGKERLILFHIVADLGEQPDDASLIIGEDLERHVLVVIDVPNRTLLYLEQMFAGRLDLDRGNQLLREFHGVGRERFCLRLRGIRFIAFGRSRFDREFRMAAGKPSEIGGCRKDHCADACSRADAAHPVFQSHECSQRFTAQP